MNRPKLVKCTRSSANGRFVKGKTYPVTDVIGIPWDDVKRRKLGFALFTEFNADYESKVKKILRLNVPYSLQGPIVFAGKVIKSITFTHNYNTYVHLGVVYSYKKASQEDWRDLYQRVILTGAINNPLEEPCYKSMVMNSVRLGQVYSLKQPIRFSCVDITNICFSNGFNNFEVKDKTYTCLRASNADWKALFNSFSNSNANAPIPSTESIKSHIVGFTGNKQSDTVDFISSIVTLK